MMPSLAILAGGFATRLYPLTQTIPKSLIVVAGKPFIVYQLALLQRQGIQDVVICAGHLGDQIERFVGTGEQFGLSVKYSFDGAVALGTGGAIKKALPLLGDNFFLMYGDSYFDIDFRSIYQYSSVHGYKNILTVIRNKNNWGKSNTILKGKSIVCYDKKRVWPGMEWIDYGLSFLTKAAFDKISSQAQFDLSDLYQALIMEKSIAGYEMAQRFYEIGSVTGLKETEQYFLDCQR